MTDEVNANLNHSKLLLRTLRNTFPCLLGLVYLAPLLQLRKLTRWTQPPVPALSTQRELLCSFCCLENSLQHRWSLKLNTWGLGGKKEQRTGRYKSDRTEHRSQARQRQAKLLIGQALPWLQGPAPSSVKHTQTEQSRTRAERAGNTGLQPVLCSLIRSAAWCWGGACGEDAARETREQLSPDLQMAVPP